MPTNKKKPTAGKFALRREISKATDNDYILNDNHITCWIEVGDITVHVTRLGGIGGVHVSLYPTGAEMEEPMDVAVATFEQARAIKQQQ